MENQAKNSSKVFLTFDDGPSESYTSKILDILKENGAKATFFVCGKNVERYPEIAKRIVKEGHTIANHTYSHSIILSFFGSLTGEIKKTTDIIKEMTGVRTNFFRPPFGLFAPWLKRYLEENNYKIILWDIDTFDWMGRPARIIEERIFKKIKSNSIILFHDGNKDKFHFNLYQTILALPSIIKKLKAKGYILKDLREK